MLESEEFYYFLKKAYKITVEIDRIKNFDLKKRGDIINKIIFTEPLKSIQIIIQSAMVSGNFRKQLIIFLKKINNEYDFDSLKNKKEIESVIKKMQYIPVHSLESNIQAVIYMGKLVEEMDETETYTIFSAICSSPIFIKQIEEKTKNFLIAEGVDLNNL